MTPIKENNRTKENKTLNMTLKETTLPKKVAQSKEIKHEKEMDFLKKEDPPQKIEPLKAKDLDTLTKPLQAIDPEILKEKVTEVLKDIYDPEIPVNIYDLGLIYGLATNQQGEVRVEMTLTSPACPVAQTFPQTVQERILQVPQVTLVAVELVWEPPWTKERMSETAKLQLNMF